MATKAPLLDWLEKKGITLDSLVESALELFVPHPGVETREKAIEMLKAEFFEMGNDPNIATLIVAAFRAQEGHDPRGRAEQDRPGHRVRLLLRARRVRPERPRL